MNVRWTKTQLSLSRTSCRIRLAPTPFCYWPPYTFKCVTGTNRDVGNNWKSHLFLELITLWSMRHARNFIWCITLLFCNPSGKNTDNECWFSCHGMLNVRCLNIRLFRATKYSFLSSNQQRWRYNSFSQHDLCLLFNSDVWHIVYLML